MRILLPYILESNLQ